MTTYDTVYLLGPAYRDEERLYVESLSYPTFSEEHAKELVQRFSQKYKNLWIYTKHIVPNISKHSELSSKQGLWIISDSAGHILFLTGDKKDFENEFERLQPVLEVKDCDKERYIKGCYWKFGLDDTTIDKFIDEYWEE